MVINEIRAVPTSLLQRIKYAEDRKKYYEMNGSEDAPSYSIYADSCFPVWQPPGCNPG